jgi:hypothetical protein
MQDVYQTDEDVNHGVNGLSEWIVNYSNKKGPAWCSGEHSFFAPNLHWLTY